MSVAIYVFQSGGSSVVTRKNELLICKVGVGLYEMEIEFQILSV